MNELAKNILLIEDNTDDAVYIQEILANIKTMQFTVTWVSCLREGIEVCGRNENDVVLLDLSLPDSSGLDTVCKLKKFVGSTPIIVLTSLDDDETGIKTIQFGAQDYIVKRKIDEYTIRNSIRYAIERQKLISNIKTLTGLLPICSHCKKIRNDKGYWEKVEEYIRQHTQADFSHGLCPECVIILYPEYVSES